MNIHPVNIFAAGAAFGVALGLNISWMTGETDRQEVTSAVFGMRDAELEAFPYCQTDLAMSDMWSTRLMYLNGAWTAGCIDQALKLRDQRLDDMERERVAPRPQDVPL